MDNAVILKSPGALNAAPGFGARLAALPPKSKFNLGLGAAALASVVLALLLWSSQGDYKVLYANLSDKDGGAIIAQLSQMNIPYRHSDGGNAILVPASAVHDVRLKLASAGLPKASVGGFEMMDGARFGQTQFQERLTFQRGLEGVPGGSGVSPGGCGCGVEPGPPVAGCPRPVPARPVLGGGARPGAGDPRR